MNRNRFVPPPVDNRVPPALFTTPPPNFNWQRAPAPVDYPMQMNAPPFQNPQAQPPQQPFNQSQLKKSYCKTCNLWTIEPYESHITSSTHMANKTNNSNTNNQQSYQNMPNPEPNIPNKYPIRPNLQPYEPMINNNEQHMPRNVNLRNNGPQYDGMVNTEQNLPRKGNLRNNIPQYESNNNTSSSMARKGTTRVTAPPFKISDNQNSSENMIDHVNNKKNRIRRNKNNMSPQNSINFPNSHTVDEPHDSSHTAAVKLDEKIKTTTDITTATMANKGREMLLPVSGVYCTLCDQFFRNTDSAETIHCKSSTHLDAYEKLLGQLNPNSVKPPVTDSQHSGAPPTKRSKCTDKIIKPFKLHKSIENSNEVTPCETKVSTAVAVVESSVDFDQTSSSEFQGPDVSLEFPEEIEDYDE